MVSDDISGTPEQQQVKLKHQGPFVLDYLLKAYFLELLNKGCKAFGLPYWFFLEPLNSW